MILLCLFVDQRDVRKYAYYLKIHAPCEQGMISFSPIDLSAVIFWIPEIGSFSSDQFIQSFEKHKKTPKVSRKYSFRKSGGGKVFLWCRHNFDWMTGSNEYEAISAILSFTMQQNGFKKRSIGLQQYRVLLFFSSKPSVSSRELIDTITSLSGLNDSQGFHETLFHCQRRK